MRSRRIYNRIQLLRTERGLTRKELADTIGVNFQTVGYLERGEYNPSLDLAFRISEVFSLPIEVIFSTGPQKLLSEELYGTGGGKDGAPRGGRRERNGEAHDR